MSARELQRRYTARWVGSGMAGGGSGIKGGCNAIWLGLASKWSCRRAEKAEEAYFQLLGTRVGAGAWFRLLWCRVHHAGIGMGSEIAAEEATRVGPALSRGGRRSQQWQWG